MLEIPYNKPFLKKIQMLHAIGISNKSKHLYISSGYINILKGELVYKNVY